MRLELLTSKDDLRPILNYIKVDREYCVATDAHLLGVIPTRNIFDSEFIEKLGDREIIIFRDDWKHIKPQSIICWESENMIKIQNAKSGRPVYIKAENQDEIGKYPKWENVVPKLTGMEKAPVDNIGVNGNLFATIQKALNCDGLELDFYAKNRAIEVRPINEEGAARYTCNRGNFGLVMPRML